MRNYQVLDKSVVADGNVLTLSNSEHQENYPQVSFGREGAFVGIAASFGPREIALRLRHNELVRHLTHLQSVPGLAITRQTGSANAYLSMGLAQDDKLVLRPTLVADASGHVSFNLVCTSDVRAALLKWIEAE